MSQIVVCQNDNGIILAADGRAVDFDAKGDMIHLTVDRLIQLTESTAVLAGGAPDGVQMCQTLKNFLSEERLNRIEEVYAAALPFLGTEFERFMRKRCETLPLDPIHHVFFILAGYGGRDADHTYRSYLLWTKKKLPQPDSDEISRAYAAPRMMGLEHTLNRLCGENADLDRLLSEVRKGMEKVADTQDEIGPPFHYATITADGFKRVD
jgi:20S proteasome alpha/beta subunit